MGGRDQKKDFQDRMLKVKMLQKARKLNQISKVLHDSEVRVDEEQEELRAMNVKQLKARE